MLNAALLSDQVVHNSAKHAQCSFEIGSANDWAETGFGIYEPSAGQYSDRFTSYGPAHLKFVYELSFRGQSIASSKLS